MKLYLLKRRYALTDFDEYISAVVAAGSPSEARQVAASVLVSRPALKECWDPDVSTIERIGRYTGPRKAGFVVHYHFLAA